MLKFAVILFILLLALSVVIIIYDSPESPKPAIRTDREVVSNPVIKKDQRAVSTREKAHEYLPNFMKAKGLETVKLFEDMRADDSYYRKAVRNPNGYHTLVGDERIYNKDEVTLIYQYHCYQFFKHYSSIDDMKGDFLGAFLREYHELTDSEIDKLVIVADGYANP